MWPYGKFISIKLVPFGHVFAKCWIRAWTGFVAMTNLIPLSNIRCLQSTRSFDGRLRHHANFVNSDRCDVIAMRLMRECESSNRMTCCIRVGFSKSARGRETSRSCRISREPIHFEPHAFSPMDTSIDLLSIRYCFYRFISLCRFHFSRINDYAAPQPQINFDCVAHHSVPSNA